MLHHDDLVPFRVIRVQLEGIVEQRPFLLIEDLLGLLGLGSVLLFFFLLLPLLFFLLFFFLSIGKTVQNQGLNDPPVDDIFIGIVLVVELGFMLLLLFLLGSSQVENNLQHSFFLPAKLADLVVEHDVVVLEAVDGFKMDAHTIPGDLFQFLGDDLIFEDLLATLLSDLQTLPKSKENILMAYLIDSIP